MEVCGLWRFNCNLPSQSLWCVNYEYLWQVPFPCNLHRLISAAIGRRVTSDPAELPFLPGGKHLCVPYVWLLRHVRDTKCFLENFVNKKTAYVTNRLQKDERWQRLLLGDWVPCWSPQCIASVRGSIQRLMIHEREVIYLVLGRNLQAMLTTSIITLSHMCAYSSEILRLKIINNKSIEAIELSKMYTTWHLGKGGTERDNPPHRFQTRWCWLPISGSYLGYWTCRIYRWMVGPLWIYIIFFCLGRGLEITGKPYFFLIFFICHSQHCLKMCVSFS